LAGGTGLLSSSELHAVRQFTNKALSRLDPEDRELPQILSLRQLLEQGVGVHHAGKLPICKEIVEILFSEGLVKVLVATETFAVGLNMPTKTVVFCETKKFDG
jgi:antiviral helicase SKI2